MRTMLAGRLHLDALKFAVEEVPIPVPGPGEVLIEVKAAGVCLSDIHLIDGRADVALDPSDPDFADAVVHATGGSGVDVAFDFAGFPAVREQAAAVLGAGGVLVLAGITPEPLTVSNSVDFGYRGNQIRGHYGSAPEHVEQLIRLASTGRLDLAPSITAHVPLAEAADAVNRLEKKIGDPIRLVLTP